MVLAMCSGSLEEALALFQRAAEMAPRAMTADQRAEIEAEGEEVGAWELLPMRGWIQSLLVSLQLAEQLMTGGAGACCMCCWPHTVLHAQGTDTFPDIYVHALCTTPWVLVFKLGKQVGKSMCAAELFTHHLPLAHAGCNYLSGEAGQME